MTEAFKKWYEENKSYFNVKHEGDLMKMEEDAIHSYNLMKSFSGKPAMQSKGSEVKKKPNPYGF